MGSESDYCRSMQGLARSVAVGGIKEIYSRGGCRFRRRIAFDLTDVEWSTIEPPLPNKVRAVARVDDRVFNGIFWRLRTGAPWANIPDATGRKHRFHLKLPKKPFMTQHHNRRTGTRHVWSRKR